MTTGTPSTTRANAHAWRWLPVLAAFFMTSFFAIPATSARLQATSPVARASIAATAPAVYKSPARSRCPGCGRVLSIRQIEATSTTPVSFEFTVRMSDGSLHMSPAAGVGRWKAGDRIILVGGTL
jgi:hypothetical protein